MRNGLLIRSPACVVLVNVQLVIVTSQFYKLIDILLRNDVNKFCFIADFYLFKFCNGLYLCDKVGYRVIKVNWVDRLWSFFLI